MNAAHTDRTADARPDRVHRAHRVLRVAVVVGNPKAASRTATAARAVAERVAPGAAVTVVELADLAGELFDWGSERVGAAKDQVTAADLVVIASPTYKATYTGLLKAFLDRFGADELAGTPVIPVMLAAAPHHALAVEVHLRPLVVEIGGASPTRGVFLVDADVEDAATLTRRIDDWATAQAAALATITG